MNDIGKRTVWLRSSGFKVQRVARGIHWITFSVTATHAASAFHKEIHRYVVNGESHFANSTDLSNPAASGLPPAASLTRSSSLSYTNGAGQHYLAPDDLANIYDLTPIYNAGIDGTGRKTAESPAHR